ncbi:hypothetical protein [Tunturiibacter lichenicola]|uniref:hypothetical protein n=1 Tax=Tunturiibacter lichenicola TaxID=2051959 RepID=UPI003D9B1F11
MPRNTRCYEVLIASPSDVRTERQIIVECIEDWNAAHSRSSNVILQPRRWELDAYPELGDRPQEIINTQIVDISDIVLGVFWHRIGTPTGLAVSGTVEEIERFVAAKRPVSLYFSQASVPIDHDAKQLASVREYKVRMRQEGVAFDFPDVHEFRRMVSRHLASKINALTGAPVAEPANPKSDLARLDLRIGSKGRSGDVNTVKVVAEITNLSSSVRIREYSVTVSVPAACLTFESARYPSEIQSDVPGRRRFRHTEKNFSGVEIHSGDRLQVFSLDLGIDQLKMVGTNLAGDVEGTLADKIVADAVVDGETLHVERSVAEVFQGV